MPSKDDLESLIAQERPVGEFLFDEEKQCFTTDAEVIYELVEIDNSTFCAGEFIHFGGYEYALEDHERKTYTGTLDEVEEQVAREYNEENSFMGYPVIYSDFRVRLMGQHDDLE